MSPQKFCWNPQRSSYSAYLILEKGSQGLYNLKLHIVGQTSYIVVTLNGCRRPLYRNRLYHIWIDSPLCQIGNIRYLVGFLVKYFYEYSSYSLALSLGIGDPC